MKEFRDYYGKLHLHLDCPFCARFVDITFEDTICEEMKSQVEVKLSAALSHHLKKFHKGVYLN